MAVTFLKKTSRKEVNLSDKKVGTLQTIGGKGAKIAYNRKNFKGTSRVSIELTKKNGEYQYLNCSTQLSQLLRNGEISIGQLMGLDVVETQVKNNNPKDPNFGKLETTWFIVLPQDGGRVEQAVDEIEVEELDLSDSWLPSDLVSLDSVADDEE